MQVCLGQQDTRGHRLGDGTALPSAQCLCSNTRTLRVPVMVVLWQRVVLIVVPRDFEALSCSLQEHESSAFRHPRVPLICELHGT
jgi:hypothetical protein